MVTFSYFSNRLFYLLLCKYVFACNFSFLTSIIRCQSIILLLLLYFMAWQILLLYCEKEKNILCSKLVSITITGIRKYFKQSKCEYSLYNFMKLWFFKLFCFPLSAVLYWFKFWKSAVFLNYFYSFLFQFLFYICKRRIIWLLTSSQSSFKNYKDLHMNSCLRCVLYSSPNLIIIQQIHIFLSYFQYITFILQFHS